MFSRASFFFGTGPGAGSSTFIASCLATTPFLHRAVSRSPSRDAALSSFGSSQEKTTNVQLNPVLVADFGELVHPRGYSGRQQRGLRAVQAYALLLTDYRVPHLATSLKDCLNNAMLQVAVMQRNLQTVHAKLEAGMTGGKTDPCKHLMTDMVPTNLVTDKILKLLQEKEAK